MIGCPLVGIDCRVDPARVAHRPVNNERVFDRAVAGIGETIKLLFHPGCDAPVARDLRRPESFKKLRIERWRVSRLRCVNIQLGVARVRIGFIQDRRVEPLGQRFRAAEMRGHTENPVGRRQAG